MFRTMGVCKKCHLLEKDSECTLHNFAWQGDNLPLSVDSKRNLNKALADDHPGQRLPPPQIYLVELG